IDLCDEIEFIFNEKKGNVSIVSGMDIPDSENLIYKAAKLYLDFTGADFGVDLNVCKRIPMGAGLGGGSSNAATLLLGLNSYNNDFLKKDELIALGSKLGSDVPFFLDSPASLVGGRGEILTSIKPVSYSGILIIPEVHVSTPFAYKLIDSNFHNKQEFARNIELELEKPPSQWKFENTFSIPVMSEFPEIKVAYDKLLSGKAGYTAMSGSGSSVFKIFDEKNDINCEFERLKSDFSRIYAINLLVKFEKPFYNKLN
ncbi:MAG: 4-(cytidine 5'-diphospho)-2-C-methyl-D-erythritol kinase, partial [Spirochaetales bacterium]|nr:4-(cytidine 5'-diphospho)-2-C-methyl-D-erythritol kinase [Spirochaetales bacterium]